MALTHDSAQATLGELLHAAVERLAPVTESPRLDAELLLAHALGVSRVSLLARLREQAQTWETQLRERLGRPASAPQPG